MAMKVVAACASLLGIALTVIAIMAWRELNFVATSELVPTADSLPITLFVYPEFFEPSVTPAKPADVAQAALRRIYIIGIGSFTLALIGILMLIKPIGSQKTQSRSSD